MVALVSSVSVVLEVLLTVALVAWVLSVQGPTIIYIRAKRAILGVGSFVPRSYHHFLNIMALSYTTLSLVLDAIQAVDQVTAFEWAFNVALLFSEPVL